VPNIGRSKCVRVHTAGHDQLATRVNHMVSISLEVQTDAGNSFSFDQDVINERL